MQSFSSKQRYSSALVGICLIAIGGVLLWNHGRHTTSSEVTLRQAVIDVTPNGFVPASLNVKSGTVIIWQNQDSATHKIASNPYPIDNSIPGLKSGTILPNGSYRYKPSGSTTIYYHDDTKPTLNGSITVSK